MATTVQNIIDGVKWQADLQQGSRLASADLIPVIDAAYKEAWDAIVAEYDDFFVKTISGISITGGAGLNTYQIVASDFFKLKSVQKLNGSVYGPPLGTHEFNEMGAVGELSWRLEDDTIYFEPELSCNGTYRIKYVYTPADLTAAGDTIVDRTNGAIKQFCIDTVAARAALREEDADVEKLLGFRTAMMSRIAKMVGHRKAGRGKKVADTRRGNRFRFMTRSGLALPS